MAQEIQTLQPQERLSITTQPQNFVGAMTQLASTPTILGTIGATMAAGASQTYQKLQGIEAGKTPSGDLLPPITQADQAFVEGYSAQAQQTLSLQAQQLINQGQLELNKNYQLSNSTIQSYNQNMQQGLQQIIEQAPSTIRADLANQFSNQLQRDVFNLNNRLITQQKTQAKENASVYQSRQLTAMSDTALSGGKGAATQTKKILDKTLKNINGNEASGLISPVEAESQREAANQTYLNSLLSADAAQAKQTKTEAQFLNGLVQTPSEYQGMKVTPTQWDVARKQAFSYVQNLDQFTNRNQNLILSDALVKQQETGLTSSDIASLKEQLDPERFNTFYTSYLKSENSRISKTQEAQFAAANYTNPTVMAGLSTQQKNNAFDLQASNNYIRQQDLGQPISVEEAQYRAQAASPVPIPKYVNSLSASLNNPNPVVAAQAAATVSRFFDTGLGSVLGDTFSQNTRSNMMAHAISQYKMFGRSDEEAVALARETFNQPKEKLDANKAIANSWADKIKTPAQISSWAKTYINNPNGAVIPNQPVLQNQMKQVYKDYLVAFNGDEQLASSYLEQGMSRAYGVTKVNGRDEYVYMPIEQAAGLDEYATPLVLDDIYEQTQKQFANMKAIYDNPKSNLDFYYELKPRITYDQYAKAKLDVSELDKAFTIKGKTAKEITQEQDKRSARYREAQSQIQQFEAGNPIEIEQVYRNGERYSRFIEVVNNPFMSISTGENPTIGGYDIQMRDKDGVPVRMYGIFDKNYTYPAYVPNIKNIKERYSSVAKLPGQPMISYDEQIKRMLSSENKPGQLARAFMAAPIR
jgi:hypothetical protein